MTTLRDLGEYAPHGDNELQPDEPDHLDDECFDGEGKSKAALDSELPSNDEAPQVGADDASLTACGIEGSEQDAPMTANLLTIDRYHTLKRGSLVLRKPTDADAPPRSEPSNRVIGLREWASDRIFPIRTFSTEQQPATAEQSTLEAPHSRIEVVYEAQLWRIKDRRHTAGLQQDGIPVTEAVLTAGSEIVLGGMILVAESPKSLTLRQYCARLLGWGHDRLAEIDQALRAIRSAGRRRSPLLLRGEGDMAAIAQALHRYMLGEEAPFIMVDPRRGDQPATVRCPASRGDAITALREAEGGSICVRDARLPPDFDVILRAFREPSNSVQLFICTSDIARASLAAGAAFIDVPRLESRKDELPRIIDEYGANARFTLSAPKSCFLRADVEWVRRVSAQSIPDIEKGTLRAVAVRMSSSLQEAAAILGMAPISLARWLGRRTRDPVTGDEVEIPRFRGRRCAPALRRIRAGDDDSEIDPHPLPI